MKHAGNVLFLNEFKENVDVKTNFLVYSGVVSCIKLLRNLTEKQNEIQKFQYFCRKHLNTLMNPID